MNFFHGVLIGKKGKVLLFCWEIALSLLYIFVSVCVCLSVCFRISGRLFGCVFVCLCFFGGYQESACVAPLLILRGLKSLSPVTRFSLRPP